MRATILTTALPLLFAAALWGEESQTLAAPPPSWVEARVQEARQRLSASETGRLVLRSIEYHGGLSRWYGNGPIAFRFDYRPRKRPAIDTYQVVDTWSSRARHWLAADPAVEFGWDGQRAWAKALDKETGINPRFWALTPYYFLAMPFVLADPGVVLQHQGQTTLEGRACDLVRAGYEPGTGDAPDDYYVLYLDRESGRLRGLRYVVSYPGFFPQGGHTSEKLMTYDGEREVEGIRLPASFRTYSWDGQAPTELVTEIGLTEVEFRPDTPGSHFDMPADAVLVEGY